MLRLSETPRELSRLKLTLKPAAESVVRGGHPWVWSDSIRSQNREGEPGELAVIYDRRDRFLAVGFYDPDSPLRVRVLHRGKPVAIDEDFWRAKLGESLACRETLGDPLNNGFRLVNGESDGWPGLVLDRYDKTLVLKLYASAWLPRLAMVCDLVVSRLAPERFVLRLSRNLRTKAVGLEDGSVLHGQPFEGTVLFLESGIRFEADVLRGQKTGFFPLRGPRRGQGGDRPRPQRPRPRGGKAELQPQSGGLPHRRLPPRDRPGRRLCLDGAGPGRPPSTSSSSIRPRSPNARPSGTARSKPIKSSTPVPSASCVRTASSSRPPARPM